MSRPRTERRSPAALAREAIRLLDDAIEKPPAELKAEVDAAERAIVALRDELIERWRATPDSGVRTALSRTNVALSLVVGLEYPIGGLQRKLLEQARSELHAALEAGPAATF